MSTPAARRGFTRAVEHLGFAVDSDHRRGCHPLREVDGDGARTAPDVEHPRTRRERVEQVARRSSRRCATGASAARSRGGRGCRRRRGGSLRIGGDTGGIEERTQRDDATVVVEHHVVDDRREQQPFGAVARRAPRGTRAPRCRRRSAARWCAGRDPSGRRPHRRTRRSPRGRGSPAHRPDLRGSRRVRTATATCRDPSPIRRCSTSRPPAGRVRGSPSASRLVARRRCSASNAAPRWRICARLRFPMKWRRTPSTWTGAAAVSAACPAVGEHRQRDPTVGGTRCAAPRGPRGRGRRAAG